MRPIKREFYLIQDKYFQDKVAGLIEDFCPGMSMHEDAMRVFEAVYQLGVLWERERCAKIAEGFIGCGDVARKIRAIT